MAEAVGPREKGPAGKVRPSKWQRASVRLQVSRRLLLAKAFSMGDLWKEQAKAAKKAAKAQAKLLKKLGKSGAASALGPPDGVGLSPSRPESSSSDSRPSPAERSAAAAEEQVELRRRELWVSVVSTLIALVTLVLSFLSFFSSSGQ